MSFSLCVLGSGSSGNSSVIKTPAGAILIDAGFGPRATTQRLRNTGVTLTDIRAICLTHLDSDHFNPNWTLTLRKLRTPIHVHRHCRDDLVRILTYAVADRFDSEEILSLLIPFDTDVPFAILPDLTLQPFHLAHDEAGSHGFLLTTPTHRAAYATDLGHIPAGLLDLLIDLDLLALESNYDPQMQRDSDRPWHLKQRIMGGAGHLSNQQAFAAVRAILDAAEKRCSHLPRHIVLLHRSRQCNCPRIIRKLFESDPRVKPRLILSEQSTPTHWLTLHENRQPFSGEQMSLYGG